MAKFKFIGVDIIHVTLNFQDFCFSNGKIFDLSPENDYVKGLKEQGLLIPIEETPKKTVSQIKK